MIQIMNSKSYLPQLFLKQIFFIFKTVFKTFKSLSQTVEQFQDQEGFTHL